MRIPLGSYPTPVTRAELGSPYSCVLYIKRDDLTSARYGGNKARKLEYVLASAREKNKTRLLTVGAAGSHHVLATALHGRAHGFAVHAVLVGQPETKHALANLRAGLAAGLTAEPANYPSMYLHVLATMDANTEYVSLGGSNVVGSRGYVDAARELEAQVSAGEIPEPDEIVVALGSGGTVAGLLCGLEQTKLRSRVVGVAISKPTSVLTWLTKRLTRKLAREVGVDEERALARLVVDESEVGRGYGYATKQGDSALVLASELGVKLEPTYTAKAFASAVARATLLKSDAKILYWHTLSSVDLAPLLATFPESDIPHDLRLLFR